MLHTIHLTGGKENLFLGTYKGTCTNCHKFDQKTGAWSLGSGSDKEVGTEPAGSSTRMSPALRGTPQQAPGPGFAWKDGAKIYAKVCAYCHDTGVGPAIRGSGLDPAVIGFYTRRWSRAMPAFRASEIDDEALAKLAEYVSKKCEDIYGY